MNPLYAFLFYLGLMIVFLGLSIKVVREDHRLVVFRLGRYLGVKGPGMVFTVPPSWTKLRMSILPNPCPGGRVSKQDLDEKVKSLILYKPRGSH